MSGVELEVVWTGPTSTLTADTTPTGTSYTSTLILTILTASDAGPYTALPDTLPPYHLFLAAFLPWPLLT